MNPLKTGAIRIFHGGLRLSMHMMRTPEPKLLSGPGSLLALPEKIAAMGLRKVLIVTGRHVSTMPQFDALLKKLKQCGIAFTVFKDVSSNPTVENAQAAAKTYAESGCEGLVAFGGGSPMDCAKGAGILVARPGKSLRQMGGYLKVGKKLPPLFAVPTTAGSGSEATLAAVITDPARHNKYAVMDPHLIPYMAVLDPELTVSLPADTTAGTGMDALTHAVEAYIGLCGTKYTDEMAQKAVPLIFENLQAACSDGGDLAARQSLLLASYCAGCAFTRAFVGYVHAAAHALGGQYNLPHGKLNAIVLPYVLEFYGESAHKKLARLALLVGLGKPDEAQDVLAERFIARIKEMNESMGIPRTVDELRREDIPALAAHAIKEANPFYPVPKLMETSDCCRLLEQLLPKEN